MSQHNADEIYLRSVKQSPLILKLEGNGTTFLALWPTEHSIFTYDVALTGKERKNLSVFNSCCHLLTCLPHTVEATHCLFYSKHQAGKSWIPIFIVFDLTRSDIEIVSTDSLADALSTTSSLNGLLGWLKDRKGSLLSLGQGKWWINL